MALSTFPAVLPVDDMQFLVAELTGAGTDVRQTVASLIGIVSYAAGQVLPADKPHAVVPKLTGLVTVFHQQALAAHLNAALNLNFNAVDWNTVLQIALSMLQNYLAQHPISNG